MIFWMILVKVSFVSRLIKIIVCSLTVSILTVFIGNAERTLNKYRKDLADVFEIENNSQLKITNINQQVIYES